MTYDIDETHDPNLRSWVESANDPETDFPIQNLPFCEFDFETEAGSDWAVGVRIGDQILNLTGCQADDLFADVNDKIGNMPNFFAIDNLIDSEVEFPGTRTDFRRRLVELLST